MDSIDLQTLASSLPNAHQQAEAELTNNFKAAALSITTLYRSSKEASKKAHDAGYAKACCDLMQMIQRGVSADGNDMTVGRVMDWLEARLDAVKSRAEEEQEDEESTRRKPHAAPKQQPASAQDPHPPTPSSSDSEQGTWSQPGQRSPELMPSPSPPPSRPLRPLRSKPGTQPTSSPSIPQDSPFIFGSNENQATWSAPFPSAGVKRRHAVISMLDSPTSSASPLNHSSGGRRRTRSTNMEVEEEERPRKRR